MKKKVVNLKRKKSFNKSDKPKESEESNSETWKESVDSGTEDLLAGEFNEDDSSDEEFDVTKDAKEVVSDEEDDKPIFESDDEINSDEEETDEEDDDDEEEDDDEEDNEDDLEDSDEENYLSEDSKDSCLNGDKTESDELEFETDESDSLSDTEQLQQSVSKKEPSKINKEETKNVKNLKDNEKSKKEKTENNKHIKSNTNNINEKKENVKQIKGNKKNKKEQTENIKQIKGNKKNNLKQIENAKHVKENDKNNKEQIKNVKHKKEIQKVKNKKNKNENKTTNEIPLKVETTLNEYEYDTSDEEDIRNTVGNVPMKWYDNFDHIGYDWDGKKLLKPEKGDQLDNFLKRMEDPDFWRTVKDYQTGQDVVLSEADIDLITRIQKQRIPDATFDEYAPWVEWFTSEVMKTPLRKFPEHKRSFLPSKSEAKQVSKLVHALKMGWMKSSEEIKKEREEKAQDSKFYMLWQTDDQAEEMRRIHKHIPAPKRFLPGHSESYNPPPEFLFDNKELKLWHKLKATPWKRKLHFIPEKYESLRQVPAYPKYIKERFQRCLDLYLCPRAMKMKLTIEPEELVPQLPSPKDLQPFPTFQLRVFKGHTDMVRCMSVEKDGQYLVTGSDDGTVRIWEIENGRCVKVINCNGVIRSVAWCPNQAISLIAVAAEQNVLLINPGIGDELVTSRTDKLLEIIPQTDAIVSDRVKNAVQWEQQTELDNSENWQMGIRVIVRHFKTVKQVTWHGKGDYFATVMPDGQNRSVLIHQLSKRRSQIPFSKSKGLIQCVLFHPIRPFLFVATQRNVRIYDLVKQEMVKKLLSNSQWISTMAIHPGGDNLLVGTYDRKLLWFDLDLSTKPYQTLRLHATGIRGVAYHKRYPLFATGSDDRALIVCHGMVYSNLLQNPLIVPLKRLSNHEPFNDFGILDVLFHPIQPWVFSAGADSTVRLYI